MAHFTTSSPLAAQLDHAGLTFDDKLQLAFEVAASNPDISPEDVGFPDSYVTLALYRLNTILTRVVDLDSTRYNLFHEYKFAPKCPFQEVVPGHRLCSVLNEAARDMKTGDVLGVGHFLRAVVGLTLDQPAWEYRGATIHNTFSAETLLWGLGHSAWTSTADAPELRDILGALDGRNPIDAAQYLLTLENNRIVFRPTSILDPCRVAEMPPGGTSQLAVLTGLKKHHGLVTPDEILEFEDLINNSLVTEAEIQRFLERHNEFLRIWEHTSAHPQTYLVRADAGPLIPDFILVDPALQRATVVDLKLPSARIVTRKKNRDRLSSHVAEARAQLLEYRDWFSDPQHRRSLESKLGMTVYAPRLGLVVGSSTAFKDEFDRQRLLSREPDLDLFTYDDLLNAAQRRLALIASAGR